MSNEIGEIFEEYGEKRIQWRIPDFMSLVRKIDLKGAKDCYDSPKFYYADCCWCFTIIQSGNNADKSTKYIGLEVRRMDWGVPKTLSFFLSILMANGEERLIGEADETFSNESPERCWPKLLHIPKLLNSEADVIPFGILTFICTLKSQLEQPAEETLFKRLWNLSLSLKNILHERKRTDVVLKVEDEEMPAHRIILESRSSVFNSKFGIGEPEADTIGAIEDKEAFKVVLSYVYTGNPEGLRAENAWEVYHTANKYDLKELKKFCVEFMQECLTANTVCDAIISAQQYGEMKLQECAKSFFRENASEVFKTEEWNIIKKNNTTVCCNLVEYVFGEGY